MQNLTTDANKVPSSSKVSNEIVAVTIDQITELERSLDLMEKVSLVYLLYDHVEIALQHLIQLLNGALLDVIVEWSKQAVKTHNWHEKLIEALSIIQNYCAIAELGYNTKEVCDRFLPMNSNTSLFIDLKKKKLYRILESMNTSQMRTFLTHISNDFTYKNLTYKEFPLPYMEMYFLHWQSIGYISSSDLSNVIKAFKVTEMYDEAESLIDTTNMCMDHKRLTESKEENYNSVLSTTSSVQQDRIWSSNYEDKRYFIDPQMPGICLIINQENFYTEPDPQWAHLLPKNHIQLDNREGTTFDCNSLRKTFEMFGYTIIIKNNLTHEEIVVAVKETVNLIRRHSSFILCVLSHGLQGMVYGVNSIPVEISDIRTIICTTNTKHLKTKPKVLVLQACQGTECQLVSDDDDDDEEPPKQTSSVEPLKKYHQIIHASPSTSRLQNDSANLEMDGGSRPKTADVLLFWATVPGYGAIRDTTRGSWFIQSLCSHVQQRAHEMHFEDICTLVKQEVIDKRWKMRKKMRAMVPNKESTLSRFFFLPPIKISTNI